MRSKDDKTIDEDIDFDDAEELELPQVLPVLPVKELVIFPETVSPLVIGKERSIRLIDDALAKDRLIAVVTVKTEDVEDPTARDIYGVGVAAGVHKMLKMPDGTLRVLVQGLRRIAVDKIEDEEPYITARVHVVDDFLEETRELEALRHNVVSIFSRMIEMLPNLPDELKIAVNNIDDPIALGYFIASTMRLKTTEKQELLQETNVMKRLRRLTVFLTREMDVLELGSKIQNEVQNTMEKGQREYVLRQQMRAIQEELGELDEVQAEVNELREKVAEAKMPEDVEKVALREIERLEKMPPAAGEYSVIRTYLDWLITMPWQVSTVDEIEIKGARKILDEDHYDLEKVKERILEYLAVRKMKEDMAGPILCFVGPPGVGKTSLGRSIARAMGRKFVRISLGGVHDEAEIRGHRRTYVGALPGSIMKGIRDAGTNNPVFMMDEVDKLGMDFRGDPSSALLEVLDPEQNVDFRDHYLDVSFDLSKVMFITTANMLDTIPPPLRDRMEIIQLSGYTEEEKLHIARKYLIGKQLKAHGIKKAAVQFSDDAMRAIIRDYTHEAGVRELERQIAAAMRKYARRAAERRSRQMKVVPRNLRSILGKPRYFSEAKRRTAVPGVATGLAWTESGGEILFIEAREMPGTGRLILTGQLGDVMKESAQAALTYVRSKASVLGLPDDHFQKHDIHIHVPEGAMPKDGPSAGITMATALTSMLTGRKLDPDLAMTGEITLSGQVLPIGGLKEKILAAKRAGISEVIIPFRNGADVEEVPAELRKSMSFIKVKRVDEVIEKALGLDLSGRKR